MLRRSFLATAALAPFAAAGSPGSSVAPIGKGVGTTAAGWCPSGYTWDGDGCIKDYTKMVNWSPTSWRSTVDYYSSYWATGQMQLPANTLARYSEDDPLYQAQFTPGQYLDWRDLANMAGVAALGESLAQNRIYAYRNGWFAGGALAAWVGWNTGTFIHLNGVAVDSWIRTNLGTGAWMGAVADGPSREVLANSLAGGQPHVILIIRLR